MELCGYIQTINSGINYHQPNGVTGFDCSIDKSAGHAAPDKRNRHTTCKSACKSFYGDWLEWASEPYV